MRNEPMTFNDFIDQTKNNIMDYLPESYQDASVNVVEVQKMNTTYMGLQIRKPDEIIAPSIDMNHFYEEYCNGKSMEMVMTELAAMTDQIPPEVEVPDFGNYDRIKEQLFIRICDIEQNKDYLADKPYQEVDGLATTVHMYIGDAESLSSGIMSTTVSYDMMNQLGVSKEQLFADAIENSEKMFPARYQSLSSVLMGMMPPELQGSDMEAEFSYGVGNEMMILTNQQSLMGASAMMYPDMLDGIAKDMNSNLFILPSSLHEVIIIPDTGDRDYTELEEMVQLINAEQVAPNDRLSDHVYHYDISDRTLERASTYEMRKEQERVGDRTDRAERGRADIRSDREHGAPGKERDAKQSVLGRLDEKKAHVASQPKHETKNRSNELSM